jgi:hypothetical protein
MEQNINEVNVSTSFSQSDYVIASISGRLRRVSITSLFADALTESDRSGIVQEAVSQLTNGNEVSY